MNSEYKYIDIWIPYYLLYFGLLESKQRLNA